MDDLIPADLQPYAAGAESLSSAGFSPAGLSPAGFSPAAMSPAGGGAIRSHLFRPHLTSTGCTQPIDLLIAARRAVDLIGRDDELSALAEWMASPLAISARCVAGRAGSGKTRLAIELCAQAEAQGWSAGFLMPDPALQDDATAHEPRPVLAVVDRAGASLMLPQIRRLLIEAARSSGVKLRVLLLDRIADECRAGLGRIGLPADPAEPVWLGGLRSSADRDRLLGQTMALAARLSGAPACVPPAGAALDSGEPLHVQMAGLLCPHHGIATALAQPARRLAQQLAMREFARLEHRARSMHLEPLLVTHFAACVTLRGGCAADAAPLLLEQEAQCLGLNLPGSGEYVADCIGDALLDEDRFAPVGPDLVGEAFIISALIRHSPEMQAGIIDRSLHHGGPVATDTLRRLVHDHACDDPAHAARAWLRQAGG